MSDVPTALEEFQDMNCLIVEAGTNCPKDGDSGAGGRTIFRLKDNGGTDLRLGVNGSIAQPVTEVEVVVGGDAECRTLILAWEFAAQSLRAQQRVNEHSTNIRSIT